jgi:tetratricopeptide (TPR) repeat protein
MSLLLEALKKAELAKQRAASADAPQDAEAAGERATPVITREKLPDIGEHVEILSDDLPSAKAKPTGARETPPARLELAIAPEPEPRRTATANERPGPESQEAARRLFEVKEIDYNPKRPFYLTLVVLGVVGVAYGGYVWWQLQPKYVYNAQAPRDSKERPAYADKGPAQAMTAAAAPSVPSSVASPIVPGPASVIVPAQAKSVTAVPRAPAPPAQTSDAAAQRNPPMAPRAALGGPVPQALPAPVAPASEPAGAWRQSIAINPSSMQIDPQLERAYEAVQRNDLDAAREIYQGVLLREPNNRDALLGLAAIDVRMRNYEIAEARYLRLLELDPRDGYAHAGLLALRQADPVASESRLKNLLATQPESPQLYFALGNQYALQSRWGEAQQAYFRALSADPENPDYAFNLAVSLDHLHQKAQAVEFYRRSLVLADRRSGSFDRALAAARVRDLQQK